MSAILRGSKGSMTVELGPTRPTYTDGVGGWQEVARPRRKGMTEWRGPNPAKATLQVLFDGFAAGRSVEADVAALRTKFAPAIAEQEPPRLTVTGAWPIPSTVSWVVQSITVDDFIRVRSATVRAFVTVELLEYVAGDVVTRSTTAAKRASAKTATAGKTSAAAKTYTVKAGDTLSKIAAAKLGNWRRYTEIAQLNGIRDPNRLTVGRKLRLP